MLSSEISFDKDLSDLQIRFLEDLNMKGYDTTWFLNDDRYIENMFHVSSITDTTERFLEVFNVFFSGKLRIFRHRVGGGYLIYRLERRRPTEYKEYRTKVWEMIDKANETILAKAPDLYTLQYASYFYYRVIERANLLLARIYYRTIEIMKIDPEFYSFLDLYFREEALQ